MIQFLSKVATACAFERAKSNCCPKAALLSLSLTPTDGAGPCWVSGGGGVLVLESVDFLLTLWSCIGMLPGSLLLLL